MKKLIIIAALAVLLIPASVSAANWYVNKWSTHIVNVGRCPDRYDGACVSKFVDNGNTCYVVQENQSLGRTPYYPHGISCVRGE